ncbi:MAG: PA14 domain-containing protein [Sedimentisphaerales bacterium]
MFKKSIYLVSLILVLGLAAGAANADIASGLVGYYPLDEGAGDTAFDISGNGHDGTLHNGVTWISPGFKGSGVNVDGTANSRIELGTWNPAEGTGQMSLALWIRWAGGGGTYQGLIGKRDTWPGETMFQFQVRPENDGTFRLETGTIAIVSPNGTMAPLVQTWAHVATTFDGTTARLYLNGEEIMSGGFAFNTAGEAANMGIGCVTGGGTGYSGNGEVFSGDMDEVRIYNRALSEAEILATMEGEIWPYAFGPDPANGALYSDSWVTLSWSPGETAVSHDVYMGDNFADVNDGTAETFRGNYTTTYLIAGFPGYPYPEGLVSGTTYYWRVDEVNDADPNSPWKGKVWSFTVPLKTASNPNPADGAKFIDPDTNLSWSAGLGSKSHTVYFGDNFDSIYNAVGGPSQADTTYDPGPPLEFNKTYYWRVDEFDIFATHKGEVWSFTTAGAGGGIKGDYYRGTDLRDLVLTRMDPQINFSWGEGSPDPLINVDLFSVRWTGEVEAAYTETYTFYTLSDDGVRLWIDGQQLIDDWNDHGDLENRGNIDLVAGNVYSLVLEYYENVGGATAQLRWSSPSTPKALIPQAALSPPVKAGSPNPPNGAVDVKQTPILKWSAGDDAVSHQFYFGADEEAVKNADTASPEYKGPIELGAESYDPGLLEWNTTYYWRIDEVNDVNPDSPWIGSVWSFTTADFLVVDDFEDYDSGNNQIWYSWHDGLGYGVPGTELYFAGNGTGSAVGWDSTPSYTEETIVHGGNQSMPLYYDNNILKYSEVELTPTYPRDWTEKDVNTLTIWFRGNLAGFVEEPAGTYTMTASGTDIWDTADEFRYAFKQLSGAGTISAQVLSVQNTNGWAKAGVMIRETLEPGSKHAFMDITPGYGASFQVRNTIDGTSFQQSQIGITAPYWVKVERDAAGYFSGYHSADGVTWQQIQEAPPVLIPMSQNVYIGLAVTSHSAGVTCKAEFSDVQITGSVSPPMWTHQAIGATMASNDPEPMYVALNGNAVIYHDNPNAAQIDTWTKWDIDLQAFADQGVNLTNVNTIAIGFGDKMNPQAGGSGTMYFDDIQLLPEP